jgi:hypothetical protein
MWSEVPPAAAGVGRIAVLVLHRVAAAGGRDHDIAWETLGQILDAVRASGTRPVTRLFPLAPGRGAAVALTFDDGTADHARVADVLAAAGMRAIFFVPAGAIGARGRLAPAQVRALAGLGHVVGCHGYSEARLDRPLGRSVLEQEVGDSKRRLEDLLGAEVAYFAPPGGRMSRAVARALPAYGYTAARSLRWGIYASRRDRWAIPAVPVTELTVAQGWVRYALRRQQMPLMARWLGSLKGGVPESVRVPLRAAVHARYRHTVSRDTPPQEGSG